MQITTIAKDISTSSTLPTFESYFKSLIDPNLITISDQFDTNAGALNGRVTSNKTWAVLGTAGGYWQVYSGYAATTTATTSRALLPHATSGKVYVAVEYQSGFIGLLIRATDASNLVQITLASASNGLRVEKIVGSVNTVLLQKSLTLTAGKIYHLAAEYDATTIKVYVDNEQLANISETDLANNSNIGIVTSVTANKIYEIVAR